MDKTKPPVEPVHVPDRDDVHVVANRCPFCRDTVSVDDDATLVCQRCLARHHAPCWSEDKRGGGRCSACGATERLAPVKAPTLRATGTRVLLLFLATIGVLTMLLVGVVVALLPRDMTPAATSRAPDDYVIAQTLTPRAFQVPDGMTLLVSDGTRTGAVVFDSQRSDPEWATFRWFLRDGPGTLDPREPGVRTGTGATVRVMGESGLRVRFGPFDLEWSGGAPGGGFVYASSATRLRLTPDSPAETDPAASTYLDDIGREWPATSR